MNTKDRILKVLGIGVSDTILDDILDKFDVKITAEDVKEAVLKNCDDNIPEGITAGNWLIKILFEKIKAEAVKKYNFDGEKFIWYINMSDSKLYYDNKPIYSQKDIEILQEEFGEQDNITNLIHNNNVKTLKANRQRNMEEKIAQLKENHIKNVKLMIDAFCQKHNFKLEGIICCEVFVHGGKSFNLSDIEYDLFNDLPENEIIEWWDYNYKWRLLDPTHSIGLYSWHIGKLRRSEKMYQRILKQHDNIIKAEEKEMKSGLKGL